MNAQVDVLAVALFETYARNGGNVPDEHYDRIAGEQWMAQALDACGVADLIEAAKFARLTGNGPIGYTPGADRRLAAALARCTGEGA